MSLGDHLRMLRAKRGGITPWDIEAATDLEKGLYRQIEQRYRAVGSDDSIKVLADFFGVPFEDLRWRLDWPRKALSYALAAAQEDAGQISLWLSTGQVVTGCVEWWDLGAVKLVLDNTEDWVIQRHAVEKWDPTVEVPEGQSSQ